MCVEHIRQENERAKDALRFMASEWQRLCIAQAKLDQTPASHVRIRTKLADEIADHKFNLSRTSLRTVTEETSVGSKFVTLGGQTTGLTPV